jgi:hypothetical protein
MYLKKWNRGLNVYQLNLTGIPKNVLRKFMNNKVIESLLNYKFRESQ